MGTKQLNACKLLSAHILIPSFLFFFGQEHRTFELLCIFFMFILSSFLLLYLKYQLLYCMSVCAQGLIFLNSFTGGVLEAACVLSLPADSSSSRHVAQWLIS